MANLTDRQTELLDFLKKYYRDNGIMPSTRDIQKHFNFSSQTAAMSHLKALERKGVIERRAGKARAVVFPDDMVNEFSTHLLSIPVFGQIPAGMTSDSVQESGETLAIAPGAMGLSRSTKAFALKVRGDSMINAHILDGDYVILEPADAKLPKNRDIVAALIDGETTLKRFIVEGDGPYLKAENPHYPDIIPVQSLEIQGVMVGLMRPGGWN